MTHLGTTVKLKINKSMTVASLIQLAENSAPTGVGWHSALLSFDRQHLENLDDTVEAAGLCGTQVMQQRVASSTCM